MGVQKGLAAIKEYNEAVEARKKAAAENKLEWLTIPDGKTYEVRFLQELDESGAGYVEGNGLGFFATEHSNPADYRKKALCTIDEGQCYGCEQSKAAYQAGDKKTGNGWRATSRLYINVLVRDDKGEEKVLTSSWSNGSKSTVAPLVLMHATQEGTITDRWWKIRRTGKGSETAYLPMAGAPKDDVNPADYTEKIWDLDKAIREVPYESQEAHYTVVPTLNGEGSDEPSAPPVDNDEVW